MQMQSDRPIKGFARINASAVARRQLKVSLGLVALIGAATIFTAAVGQKSEAVASAKAPTQIHHVFKTSPRV